MTIVAMVAMGCSSGTVFQTLLNQHGFKRPLIVNVFLYRARVFVLVTACSCIDFAECLLAKMSGDCDIAFSVDLTAAFGWIFAAVSC